MLGQNVSETFCLNFRHSALSGRLHIKWAKVRLSKFNSPNLCHHLTVFFLLSKLDLPDNGGFGALDLVL